MHHNVPESAGLVCTQQGNSKVPARAIGCFKLNAGRAMSLTPNVPGELRIAHGRVWVTLGESFGESLSHAGEGAAVRAGDHFLGAGDLLRLQPGQHVVMEVYEKNADKTASQPIYFSWEPDAATSRVAFPRRAQHAPAGVRQPLLDLGVALHQAGWALSRLAQGMAGHAVCTLMPRRTAP